VGFQYHRARWMEPRTGRFLGIDPALGSPFDPATLHVYLYAAGGPSTRVDPSGRSFLAQTITVAAIIGSVTGAITGGILDGWKGAAAGALAGGLTAPLAALVTAYGGFALAA